MKAWIVRDTTQPPELMEMPLPQPKPGQVLVRVAAAGLNFADVLMARGAYQVRPPLPFTPGQEISGIVESVAGGGAFRPGDRVATKVMWGGLAQFAVAEESWLIRVPDEVPLVDAAALPVVWPTAWIALFERARLRPGETVLVHAAAGGVGLAATQLAVRAGARVIATAGGADKLALSARHGASACIDYRQDDWVEQVMEATGGKGVDVVIDSVGGDITDRSVKCLAFGARLCIVGFSSGRIPEIRANRLLLKSASALGIYWSHERDLPLIRQAMDDVLAGFKDKRLQADIGGRYAFQDLPGALADLESRRSSGKLVVLPDSSL
ncbi:NADPH:quinone oxidoreductase family protein [Variovorax sp. M-6]|uniref:NADPH:quinone oxidoreductase family protein n=1 Tax=Variovorax sp. M-6 TaxID=3233041 RepID=UPI003F9DF120